MRIRLTSTSNEFLRDTSAVTLVEYGIAVSLAVAVGVLGLIALGQEVDTKIDSAGTILTEN